MPAYRDRRTNVWRYRKRVRLPDGQRIRVEGTSATNTRLAAEAAERAHIERALAVNVRSRRRRCPTFEGFAGRFLDLCRLQNKPSEIESKEGILRVHLKPAFGRRRLDQISYAQIQDYSAGKLGEGLAPKTVQNHLIVLRRLLGMAKKRGEIQGLPEIRMAEGARAGVRLPRLRGGASARWRAPTSEWAVMIIVGAHDRPAAGRAAGAALGGCRSRDGAAAGRRGGHAWGDRARRRAARSREIPLNEKVLAALKRHRHLRGRAGVLRRRGTDAARRATASGRCGARARRRACGADWMARAAAHLRLSPRDARCAAQGGPGAARPRHDRDDDALRAPEPRRAKDAVRLLDADPSDNRLATASNIEPN